MRRQANKVIQYPNSLLSMQTISITTVTKQIHQDIQYNIELLQNTENAAALAANQSGSIYNFFSYFVPNTNSIRTVLNPVILSSKDRYIVAEGCLSFSGTINIPRYRDISVSYMDFTKMEVVQADLHGFESEIFQHECEHLRGSNFTTNLMPDKRAKYLKLQKQR